MNSCRSLGFSASIALSVCLQAAPPPGPVFYGDPPDDHHPWAVHDRNRPQPKVVVPGSPSSQSQPGKPPSDAIILFDGSNLSQWESEKGAPSAWIVRDGYMEAKPGAGKIRTKTKFADCQLHVEWAAPTNIEGESQGRGNSGVFLMDLLEIQVLDNYNNPTYADGTAGAYYGINPPLANALRPPGEFQSYDIIFRKPVYHQNQVLDPGYVTVFVNGVLVQDHTPLEGPGGHMGRTKPRPFPESGPLSLQDHGNPVKFRSIWYRELPPRPSQGGTEGFLTLESALQKRREIAAAIRQDASTLRNAENPLPEMLRLLESLIYENEAATAARSQELAESYVASIRSVPANQLAGRRDEVRNVANALKYLGRFKIIAEDYPARVALDALIKAQGWDKRPRP